MNTFKVTMIINTYSDEPEEWITDSVGDHLEDDESIVSLDITSVSYYYVKNIPFDSKDDALEYCRQLKLSPTLIHHEPLK